MLTPRMTHTRLLQRINQPLVAFWSLHSHAHNHQYIHTCPCNQNFRAWEMAQQWRTLAAFLEDPGLIPNTYTAAHNHHLYPRSRGSDAVFWPLCAPGMHPVHKHTWKKHTHTHKITTKKIRKEFFPVSVTGVGTPGVWPFIAHHCSTIYSGSNPTMPWLCSLYW